MRCEVRVAALALAAAARQRLRLTCVPMKSEITIIASAKRGMSPKTSR